MYTLKVDNREKDLIRLIPALLNENSLSEKVSLNKCNLDLGDFIIENNLGDELIIIERKSVNDLASSIQDGRYSEQSLRLSSTSIHNHNIMYIIEGSIENYYNKYSRVSKEALYSTLFSLNYYKGFSVLSSASVLETGTIIVKFLKKMLRDTSKQPYYKTTEPNNSINDVDYTSVIKRVKKDNINPENIGEIILSQIPGISSTMSKVVMDKYGSLYELMMKLHENPNLLNNETYVTAKGQKRRISHKCIQSIKEYLLYKKQNTIQIDTKK